MKTILKSKFTWVVVGLLVLVGIAFVWHNSRDETYESVCDEFVNKEKKHGSTRDEDVIREECEYYVNNLLERIDKSCHREFLNATPSCIQKSKKKSDIGKCIEKKLGNSFEKKCIKKSETENSGDAFSHGNKSPQQSSPQPIVPPVTSPHSYGKMTEKNSLRSPSDLFDDDGDDDFFDDDDDDDFFDDDGDDDLFNDDGDDDLDDLIEVR